MHLVRVAVEKNSNDAVENNMIIILRRIPADTNKQDILDYLNPVLKGGVFQKPGYIEGIKILILRDTQNKELEYHALVTIDSDSAASRVIKKLNRKVFLGKHIAVREYFHRSWHNDPRINIAAYSKKLLNKRKGDRRQAKLELVDSVSVKFSNKGD